MSSLTVCYGLDGTDVMCSLFVVVSLTMRTEPPHRDDLNWRGHWNGSVYVRLMRT